MGYSAEIPLQGGVSWVCVSLGIRHAAEQPVQHLLTVGYIPPKEKGSREDGINGKMLRPVRRFVCHVCTPLLMFPASWQPPWRRVCALAGFCLAQGQSAFHEEENQWLTGTAYAPWQRGPDSNRRQLGTNGPPLLPSELPRRVAYGFLYGGNLLLDPLQSRS